MKAAIERLPAPHLLLGAACCGIAAANVARIHGVALAGLVASSLVAVVVVPDSRLVPFALGVAVAGLWWGGARLDAIDRSPLTPLLGTAERAQVVVTTPPRRSRFDVRVQGELHRFGRLHATEPILLELPAGRAPAQGDVLEALGVLRAPHGPENGFDERTWLRRHGIHTVLRVDRWRVVGRRSGLGGVADRLRAFVTRGLSRGSSGERRAVLLGVVLGADEGLSQSLRDRFRASGLYHLLRKLYLSMLVVASSGAPPRQLRQEPAAWKATSTQIEGPNVPTVRYGQGRNRPVPGREPAPPSWPHE